MSKNNNENIKNTMPTSTISTRNTQDNISKELFSYSNINNLKDKKYIHKFKNVELNKNNNIIISSKKKFKCAILSKEVNDIISNYSSRTHQNEKLSEILNKKSEIYDYKNEIKNNEKIVNSFLNTKKKIKSNYTYNLTQRYNNITEPNNLLFNDNKAKKLNNKENDNSQFYKLLPLYKLQDKNKKNLILPFQNKLFENEEITNSIPYNISIYNTLTEPKIKQKNLSRKKKNNNKSNSLSSFNENNLYSNQNKMVINNKYNNYSQKTFINNYKFDNDSKISQKYINNYNYTERSNNKII